MKNENDDLFKKLNQNLVESEALLESLLNNSNKKVDDKNDFESISELIKIANDQLKKINIANFAEEE
ncbi:MAG: hypothetical protein ACJ0GG_03250 [Candidatus Actinomarina sp.]|tara:strand:+ start:61 stop:261 length:201 start_codon:yes stop_codon:yes gene_type:complete